jgi:hypothetical protein
MPRAPSFLAFAAASITTPASARPAATQEPQGIPVQEAQVELAGYADCVVSRKSFRKPVAAFLRTVPGSPSYFPTALKAADMTCLNAAAMRRRASKLEMKIQPDTFRDALYPALYRRDFGKLAPPMGLVDLQPLSLAAEFEGGSASLPAEYKPGRAFGDCVARKAPQDVHALLIAEPYSGAESAAIERLKPALGYCLSNGQTVKFSRGSLRAFTGEAMYKLAVATQSGTAG